MFHQAFLVILSLIATATYGSQEETFGMKRHLHFYLDITTCIFNPRETKWVDKDPSSSTLDSIIVVGGRAAISTADQPTEKLPRTILPTPAGCGEVKRQDVPKVVGGRFAQQDSLPWMVLFSYIYSIEDSTKGIVTQNKKTFCGGTLISDRHVLTAAHCFKITSWSM